MCPYVHNLLYSLFAHSLTLSISLSLTRSLAHLQRFNMYFFAFARSVIISFFRDNNVLLSYGDMELNFVHAIHKWFREQKWEEKKSRHSMQLAFVVFYSTLSMYLCMCTWLYLSHRKFCTLFQPNTISLCSFFGRISGNYQHFVALHFSGVAWRNFGGCCKYQEYFLLNWMKKTLFKICSNSNQIAMIAWNCDRRC